jgi:N-glycosylase/DNA lyase
MKKWNGAYKINMTDDTAFQKNLLQEIRNIHASIVNDIEAQLGRFNLVWQNGSDEDIFIELVFCLLTPQSKARSCWKAVELLNEKELIFKGCSEDISGTINIVRFRNNKAKYIVLARNMFFDGGAGIKEIIKRHDDVQLKREWLVRNVKGMGYKEASHFLRNIGFGDEIAILDRHILKNLALFRVIDGIPDSITGVKYLGIEEKMKRFSDKIRIPMSHLDFVLWYKEAGEVFK